MQWIVRLPVPLFAAGALFHVATLLEPSLGEPSPPWRHALFVAINALYATLFAVRPRWLALLHEPQSLLYVRAQPETARARVSKNDSAGGSAARAGA